jgi:hypothetical protein
MEWDPNKGVMEGEWVHKQEILISHGYHCDHWEERNKMEQFLNKGFGGTNIFFFF